TAVASAFIFFGAQAQIVTPQPSPSGSVSSKVGLTDVTVDYYRPKVKGRQIFGAGDDYLQPYGQTWRTGANQGSVLTLSTDAMIAGKEVKAGEYLIFTVPGENEWSFMLYSDLSIGGNVAAYKKENEVLSTTVKPTKLGRSIETLTFLISDISEDNTSANIEMMWDDVSIKVPMKVNFDQQVMADISAKTKVNPANYVQAANYYYATGKDMEQALEWINMYLANENTKNQFWNIHLKAQILAKMGKKKEAIETAKRSIEVAKANEGGDFGYVKRNEELIASLK
ncbi:DUF2911 domain-containing protein, partial [Fulvivirga aurantia]|uniref:DUF2911 domain-containing protein n=1 Tax=Fulvivirga aurantia TaxID=2529383 RepID=UPI0012BBFB06